MGSCALAFRFRQKVTDRGSESVLAKHERERISAHHVSVVAQQEYGSRGRPRGAELDPEHVVFETYLKLSNCNQRRGHDPIPPLRVKMMRIPDRGDDVRRTSW